MDTKSLLLPLEISSQIIFTKSRGPILQQNHDQVIMDIVLHSPKFTITDKLYLNRCRIYLHAETIADLTNAAGTHLLSESYLCLGEGVCPTKEHWLYQPRPGPSHREKWQRFLDIF